MKVLSLTIKNVGLIADTTIKFDKPLILFFGAIQNGKTTILNAVRWCFGGAVPSALIRHGAREASVCLEFEEDAGKGSITREWYINKEQQLATRGVTFIRAGKVVPKPVDAIKMLLNPFLLNQNHLQEMGEVERKRFFTELFHVDTKELDGELLTAAREASELRTKIKMYGDIDLTPVEKPNVTALREKLSSVKIKHAGEVKRWRAELAEIQAKHQAELQDVARQNEEITKSNRNRSQMVSGIESALAEIVDLEKRIEELRGRVASWQAALEETPERGLIVTPDAPDTSALEAKIATQPDTAELEAQISNAAAQEVRYENHQKALARAKARTEDELKLVALEKRQREIKAAKTAKLKGIGESSGVPGLAFDEEGEFSYQGTAAGMLSTSQLMELSTLLSGLYPPGFGIDLLDRAESLGTSIFKYVDRAKAEGKTILATIVGEAPAEVPENIGVYVVEAGKVSEVKGEGK